MMRAAFAAFVTLLTVASTARAADFADPGARVFGLAHGGTVSAIATLPNGDVVYAFAGELKRNRFTAGKLMRVTASGASYEVRGDGADLLAPESPETVLRVREFDSDVERVDVRDGTVTTVTSPLSPRGDRLDSAIRGLTVLEDGTAVLATQTAFYEIAPDGRLGRLALSPPISAQHPSMAPLQGRRFAYSASEGLMIGDLTGGRRLLAGGISGPIAASGDGGVLAIDASSVGASADPASHVVRIGPDGTVTERLAVFDRPPGVMGTGSGLALFKDHLPSRSLDTNALALAGDGSLVFADPGVIWGRKVRGLRALVPPDSGRPGIALTQNGFATVASGGVRYVTSVPGTVTVIARRGQNVIAEGHGEAPSAGEHEIALDSVPPASRYELRLRLTTPVGGAEALESIDTRPVLPLREARAALGSAYEDSIGDEGGSDGTKLGTCRRDAPRVVRCLLLVFTSTYHFSGPEAGRWSYESWPVDWVTATLLNDGVHTAREPLPRYEDPRLSSCLRTTVDRHQRNARRRGIEVRVRMRCSGRVRVAAHLRWRAGGRRHHASRARTRRMRSRETWRVTLRLPRRATSAMRARRKVNGELVARAELPTPYGGRREEQGFPIFLRG